MQAHCKTMINYILKIVTPTYLHTHKPVLLTNVILTCAFPRTQRPITAQYQGARLRNCACSTFKFRIKVFTSYGVLFLKLYSKFAI